MGRTIILTQNPPEDLATFTKAEAYQISLLGGPTGDQRLQEQHGWWDEQNQKPTYLATTLAPEEPLPLESATKQYFDQVARRVTEGFVHSRSYSFTEGKFVYRNLTGLLKDSGLLR